MYRVLVVDDCPDQTLSLSLLLKLWGYEPLAAHNGPAALELAARFRPVAALVDVVMPGMDGYEVARRLRALPGLKHALVVAMTGHGSGRGRAAPAGDFDLHLLKPVESAELQRLLAGVAPVTLDGVARGAIA